MSLADRLGQDYIKAYKAHDANRLGVLRLLKTAMTNRLVELKQPGGTLDDEEIMSLILRQAKQRKDSIEQYEAAGRKDLADKEAAELAILEEYLPRQLTAEELEMAVDEAIAKTGAADARAMGKVMGAIMGRYKGRVDGKTVSAMLKKKLAAS